MPKDFDLIGEVMRYEEGDIDREDTLRLFQYLVDTGMAWQLQGHYGRTAARLLETGMIEPADSKDARQS